MTAGRRSRAPHSVRHARVGPGRIQWRRLVRLGPFRWHDVAAGRAVRVAIGVLVPLIAGAVLGRLDYGAFASLGALPAGFASFQGVARTRVAAVAASSAGMAVSTFVGGATAEAMPWLLVAAVVVWGYVTGLAVCLGRRLSVAILQWPVALLIATGIPLGPGQAALRAGLVLAGGLFQGVLVAVSWTLRRGDPERAALAASYRSLAGYAHDLAGGSSQPPPPVALPAAATLADPNPLLPEPVRLIHADLLEQAERLRASLAALARRTAGHPPRDHAATVTGFTRAAHALDLVADTLGAGRTRRAEGVRELNELVTGLTPASGTGWGWAAQALLGQLRAVAASLARLDAVAVPARACGAAVGTAAPPGREGIAWTALTLRGNLTPAGETGRHAVRLAAVAGLAEIMVQATGLFEGRWVVLTIFLVLKPDYDSTMYRSFQRALGTAVGAVLGAAAAGLAQPGERGLILAGAIAVTAAYALFDVNYLLFSCFLTSYIVIALAMLGLPAVTTARARLIDTVIGAALALAAYSLWPTWEGLTAQEKFARLAEAHGTYSAALLRQFAHPGQADPVRLRRLQAAARRARTDAEASTARLAAEPPHPPLTPAVARSLVAAVTRMAHAELSLHALAPLSAPQAVPATGAAGGGADDGHAHGEISAAEARRLDTLAAAFATTMSGLARALRTLRPPGPLPPLRRLHVPLCDPPTGLDPSLPAITDGLVDAVDTLEAVLRRELGREGG
jgi:uncharacterized membrane protein YccC